MRHIALLTVLLGACTGPQDGRDDIALIGNEALPDCQTTKALGLLNTATDAASLEAIGLHKRAIDNILTYRAGDDAVLGTDDDRYFDDLLAVDAVPWVGPVAMEALLGWSEETCEAAGPPVAPCWQTGAVAYVNDPTTSADDLRAIGVHSRGADEIVAARPVADIEALDAVKQVGPATLAALESYANDTLCTRGETVMSPQAYHESHLVRTAELIDAATSTIDVAMYSFRDHLVLEALEDAVDRGVTVRVVFQSASEHRKDPEGTRSAELEDAGIEVRWVNKIMHHKFAILDGETLVNSSGNWSYGAATRFDENTVILDDDTRLVLSFQQEFDLMWDNSRDFVWNESIEHVPVGDAITDAQIDAASGSSALFTSDNFRVWESSTYGPTFSRDADVGAVETAIVALIDSAETSIDIASGHLRSRPISEALIAKAAADPSVRIRVYLDGQEYISSYWHEKQEAKLEDCLEEARTDGEIRDCTESGFYFGYALHIAGIDVRYKYYAYRWDYTYADQMHHKYLLIDRKTLASGSYNFSANAEFDTLENMVIYTARDYPAIITSFAENFESLWGTERDTGRYDAMLDELENGTDDIDLVFTPMALAWDEVSILKSAIREACPAVNSEDYRKEPGDHQVCPR